MALIINIPIQSLRYIPTQNIFRGPFGSPVPGKYSFGTPGISSAVTLGNLNQVVIDLQAHSWYLIERTFAGGNISAEDYLSSIDASAPSLIPQYTLKKKLSTDIVYVRPVPIIQYFQDRESPVWVNSQLDKDQLLISFQGGLVQIADTVGMSEIDLTIGLSIYQVSDADHNLIMQQNKV